MPGEALYSNALQQLYSARQQFIEDGDRLIAHALGTVGASLALLAGLAWWYFQKYVGPVEAGTTVLLFAGGLAGFAAGIVPLYRSKTVDDRLTAGYDLYCESVFHAAVVCDALRIPHAHGWIEYVHDCMKQRGFFWSNEKTVDRARKQMPANRAMTTGELLQNLQHQREDWTILFSPKPEHTFSFVQRHYPWQSPLVMFTGVNANGQPIETPSDSQGDLPGDMRQVRAIWQHSDSSLLSHFRKVQLLIIAAGCTAALVSVLFPIMVSAGWLPPPH